MRVSLVPRLPPPLSTFQPLISVNMHNQSVPTRSASFRLEAKTPSTSLATSTSIAIFVLAVLIFTIIAVTYQPDDPVLHPTSTLNAAIRSTTNKMTVLSAKESYDQSLGGRGGGSGGQKNGRKQKASTKHDMSSKDTGISA